MSKWTALGAVALLLVVTGVATRVRSAESGTPVNNLVTVELFTSQGCSSCPPADRLLSALAARSDVLALSLPVDYWDYLGWRDTFARPENTKRQHAYAKSLKTYQPYTPQIVVDGRIDVVGSNDTKVGWAIKDCLKRRGSAVPIAIAHNPDNVVVTVGPGKAAHATVWLVRYRPRGEVKIERGENKGRTLAYTNIVQSLAPIGMWVGPAQRFVLPRHDLAAGEGEQMRLALIVQEEGTGPILGAARLTLGDGG